MVKELNWWKSLFMALYTCSRPSSISSKTVWGIGGVFMSIDPSNILTTSPIEGLMKTSSWMHQNATFNALIISSSSTVPPSRRSATFNGVPFVISCSGSIDRNKHFLYTCWISKCRTNNFYYTLWVCHEKKKIKLMLSFLIQNLI